MSTDGQELKKLEYVDEPLEVFGEMQAQARRREKARKASMKRWGMEKEATAGTPEERISMDRLARRTAKKKPSLIEDILWVYGNINNRYAAPRHAPSLGAWSLLLWTREDKATLRSFYSNLLSKALVVKEKEEKKQAEQRRGVDDKTVDEVRKLLNEVRKSKKVPYERLGLNGEIIEKRGSTGDEP